MRAHAERVARIPHPLERHVRVGRDRVQRRPERAQRPDGLFAGVDGAEGAEHDRADAAQAGAEQQASADLIGRLRHVVAVAHATSAARSRGKLRKPQSSSGPTGWSRRSSRVMTPPLRSASSAPASTMRPSASTTSAPTTLAAVGPSARSSQPLPAPSATPATPRPDNRAPVTASPCSCVARSKSPHVAPPPTRAVRDGTSISIASISDRSSTMPPSTVDCSDVPPTRTACGSPRSAPRASAAVTSSRDSQRAIAAGRTSTIALNVVRARSKPTSSGPSTSPRRAALENVDDLSP